MTCLIHIAHDSSICDTGRHAAPALAPTERVGDMEVASRAEEGRDGGGGKAVSDSREREGETPEGEAAGERLFRGITAGLSVGRDGEEGVVEGISVDGDGNGDGVLVGAGQDGGGDGEGGGHDVRAQLKARLLGTLQKRIKKQAGRGGKAVGGVKHDSLEGPANVEGVEGGGGEDFGGGQGGGEGRETGTLGDAKSDMETRRQDRKQKKEEKERARQAKQDEKNRKLARRRRHPLGVHPPGTGSSILEVGYFGRN